MRKGGIIPTPSAPLLPLLNTSAALALPYNHSVSSNQNGSAFPYHSMGPFLHAQSSTLPVSQLLTSSTQVNDPQMREPSQCKCPVGGAWDLSPQHKNPIPSDCSVSSLQQKAYVNNILISGTRTLVANRSAYHPRWQTVIFLYEIGDVNVVECIIKANGVLCLSFYFQCLSVKFWGKEKVPQNIHSLLCGRLDRHAEVLFIRPQGRRPLWGHRS